MSWSLDHQAIRARLMDLRSPFVVSVADAGGAADRSICLVDLSAATAAENPHVSGSAIAILGFHIEVDVGSSVGEVLLGFVAECDATDGNIYILYDYDLVQGDRVIDVDFGDHPIICSSDYIKKRISTANYTVLQSDENYTVTAAGTAVAPAVGDVVIIYDHDTAQYTRLTCTLRYTMI